MSISAMVPFCGGMTAFAPGKPFAPSVMHAIPFMCALRPVRKHERVGEHNAVVCQLEYFNPCFAMRLRVGISIRPPKVSHAAIPVSSRITYRTLGDPSGAVLGRYGLQSGVESRISRLMMPLNCFAMIKTVL